MLAAVLLAVVHLSPPLSARPIYNAEDSNAATEAVNHAEDVKTDLNTKTGNLEMKEQNTIKLAESDQGVDDPGKGQDVEDVITDVGYVGTMRFDDGSICRPTVLF